MPRRAAVLLYPGCVFLEIAPTVDLLAEHCSVAYYTPDGSVHLASNGAQVIADGSFAEIAASPPGCVIVPGGNPDSIVDLGTANRCLAAAHSGGAILAGICAGGLVLARTGLLRGHRATHNYTLEHAESDAVSLVAPFWEGVFFERADIVIDLPFITAQHWARERFAAAVAQAIGVFSNSEATAYVRRQSFSYDRDA